MKKNKIIWGLLLVVGITLAGAWFYYKEMDSGNSMGDNVVSVGKCKITVETVATEELRKNGLSNRDSLCPNCGMLFLFEKPNNYFFWMKDMRFPIDIVWLREGKVVDLSQDVSHQSKNVHSSEEMADKVLELNAGEIKNCEIEIGDKLKN